ncbi:MAG: hypothetical protein EU541_02815 [Promethearchaeota archaeon]|nr:MAG: hypothetical protein EU541_02815 [Candidatus Lokiarchaeota archaeon]
MVMIEWYQNPLEYILENTEFLILGIATLIYVFVTLLISGKMVYRGAKSKNRSIIYMGISYFGLGSCWFGVCLNFLFVLMFNMIPYWELHFLLHGAIAPIALIFWIAAMTELLMYREELRDIILIFATILAFTAESIYIIIVFTNIDLLGTPVAPIQVDYGIFSYIYLTTLLSIFLFFGLMFVKESLTASGPGIRLKGRLLAASFLLFTIASFLEVFFEDIWIFIVARIIVMTSAIFFYIAFLK